ncbi:aminotransferase class I/II-fold pyridoxal phosphate-dependent enzyme [Spirulina major]|uniref:aminotransferase class I/II-fold pyridoxal phosphate-dependent enzyme n=1 Tax=Spirulina major TaxID=270636 RepID=UPI0009344594|nr:aminotransferase class I/II-fold pyridoxal phosphate-dependent enzyme [Spirulina major]
MTRSSPDLPLLTQLIAAAQRQHAPFYAPGHKQGRGFSAAMATLLQQAAACDLPELPELDNLFAPAGVIEAAQDLAAATFGAERTWFLVNGSSGGLIAAMLAICGEGDKIILPRTVHRSVISGLILSGAMPVFLNPPYDGARDLSYGITPEAVAQALRDHPDARGVLVVYPTYQGVCGDLGAIASLTHAHGLPLIVDEAHGPHFGFHPDLPPSALSLGADLTVQSTHKVLGALTQASMLHGQGDRIPWTRLNRALALIQTTSPSYLLLASLDAARAQMSDQGTELMGQTLALSDRAHAHLAPIPHLDVLTMPDPALPGFWQGDRTRLTLFVDRLGWDGFAVDEWLHTTQGVTAELPLARHLTFILSLGNTVADVDCLVAAMAQLSPREPLPPLPTLTPPLPPILLSPRAASFAPTASVAIATAIGQPCGELICPYPPGIPVLMPGETVTEAAIATLHQIKTLGGQLTGLNDPTLETLQVII